MKTRFTVHPKPARPAILAFVGWACQRQVTTLAAALALELKRRNAEKERKTRRQLVLWAKLNAFAKHGFASTGNWQNERGGWRNVANI